MVVRRLEEEDEQLFFLDGNVGKQCFGSRSDTGRTPGNVYVPKDSKHAGGRGPGAYENGYEFNSNRKNPLKWNNARRVYHSVGAPRMKKGEAMPGVSAKEGQPSPDQYDVQDRMVQTYVWEANRHYNQESDFGYHSKTLPSGLITSRSIAPGPGYYTPALTMPIGALGKASFARSHHSPSTSPLPIARRLGGRSQTARGAEIGPRSIRFFPLKTKTPAANQYRPNHASVHANSPTHRLVPSSQPRGFDSRDRSKGTAMYPAIGPGTHEAKYTSVQPEPYSTRHNFSSKSPRLPETYQTNHKTRTPGPGTYRLNRKSYFYGSDTMNFKNTGMPYLP